jgi:alkylhydroperoxidase family enzyme
MPRVREIETDGGHPALGRVFAEDRERYGSPLNTSKVLAHCPEVLEAARGLSNALERSGRLPAALRALVNLRVALLNGCPF